MKAKTILFALCLLGALASCSSDENSNNEQTQNAQGLQFSFTESEYGADEELTRTTETAKPQIIDLGDCEAEVTVESEPVQAQAETRIIHGPTHYTVRAYQGGTLKGEISGNFLGSTFQPDAGSKMILPHGVYDFVAFNDQVTASGNNLTINQVDCGTARIGTTKVYIHQDPKQYVLFRMEHVGARLRTQFICQKDLPAITSTLEPTAANVIPTSVTYDPIAKTYTGTNGAWTAEANNSPASTEVKYSASNYGAKYAYTSTSDYHYFLPTTEGSKLKLTFNSGKIFRKATQTGTLSQLNSTLNMQANKSYLVKIKLRPIFLYLMSDGTTGRFKDTTFGGGSKTPIAVVVDETKRMAVALRDATPSQWISESSNYLYKQVNTDSKMNFHDALALENGYEETWDGNYSTAVVTGEKVKGKNPDFPAFKSAADYTPGVSISGTIVGKKWYLPALGEWKSAINTIYFVDEIDNISRTYLCYGQIYSMGGNDPFERVGGQAIEGWHWSSTEENVSVSKVNIGDADAGSLYSEWKNVMLRVRPFIRY